MLWLKFARTSSKGASLECDTFCIASSSKIKIKYVKNTENKYRKDLIYFC